jgi:hypothetical protein
MTIDIEQLRADMKAGTPGPWSRNDTSSIFTASHESYVALCITGGTRTPLEAEHNARRIARLPDLEAEYLRLRERLEACLDWMEAGRASGDWGFWDWSEGDEYTEGRAALGEGDAE